MTLEELQASTAATITRTAAAEVLGVNPRTVGRGIEDGSIPAIRIGRRVVIPRLPFLRMLTGEGEAASA